MIKKIFLAALLNVLIVSQIASATHVIELEVTETVSVCPGNVLSANDIFAFISNHGDQTDTFRLSLKLPEEWSGFILKEVTLERGVRQKIDPFWITPYYLAQPGPYMVTLDASSLSFPGEKGSINFTVDALRCFSVDITAEKTANDVCSEEGGEATYNLLIKNNGREREVYDLSADVTWARLSETSAALDPGMTKQIQVILNPPDGIAGFNTVAITAQSRTSFAKDTQPIQINVKDCHSFNANLQPIKDDICLGQALEYTLTIVNTGLNEDRYQISTANWILPDMPNITVRPGQQERVKLTALPEKTGIQTFDVEVSSRFDTAKATGTVEVNECRDVVILASPNEVQTCEGGVVKSTISVKNRGVFADTFTLTAERGILENTSLILAPDEAKNVGLSIDTRGLKGEQTVFVTASSGEVSDRIPIKILLKNCYSAALDIMPDNISICSCESRPIAVLVKNTGELRDNYGVGYGNFSKNITLGPGESQAVNITVQIPCSGEYDPKPVNLKSDKLYLEKGLRVNVIEQETCHSVSLEAPDNIGIQSFRAVAIPVKVKNTGLSEELFEVSAKAPDWVFMSAAHVELKAQEEKEVYLYASPRPNTRPGNYVANLTVASRFASDAASILIGVDSKPEEIMEEPEEKMEKMDGEAEKVVEFNVSFVEAQTNETVPPERPSWKTAVVVVITLIIIIIILARFVIVLRR